MKLNKKILSLIIIGCFIGSIGLPTFLTDTVKANGVVNLPPIDDSYTYMRYPDNNYGSDMDTHVRNRYGASSHSYYWEKNTLVNFDLSMISEVTTIDSAEVKMFYIGYHDNDPAGRDLTIYKITSAWNEDSVNWNTMPSWSDAPSSYATVPSSLGVWMSWDVTEDVQDYLDGTSPLYGWQIMDEERWGDYNIPVTRFRTKEYTNSYFHPYLEVTLGNGENIPPTVEIEEPDQDAVVWDIVSISGVADNPDDSENMLTVFVKIDDGDWMDAEGTSSWAFEWNSSGIDEGLHTISACSYDGELFSPEDSVEVTVLDGPPAPDLECFGDLVWSELEPGSTVVGTFIVRNVGDPGTELNWEISEYPEWGLWSFEPESYSGLTPDDGDLSVEVTIVAPENPFPFFEKHFSGTISIVNCDDTQDTEIIQVSMSTPVSESPFLSWINTIIKLFYRFIEDFIV